MTSLRSTLALEAITGSFLSSAEAQSIGHVDSSQEVRTVVLVHGAFADGSGWGRVRRTVGPRLSGRHRANLRDSQVPIAMSIFETPLTQAAWRSKPSWAVVATQDRAIDPRLLRQQAERIPARIVEVPASHVPFLTHPREVADFIDAAARHVSRNTAAAD